MPVIRPRQLYGLFLTMLLLVFCVSAVAAHARSAPRAYSGNVKTKKYHNAQCRYFTCRACTVYFSSAKEAEAMGYIACQVCGG